jgi:hypothetical protein
LELELRQLGFDLAHALKPEEKAGEQTTPLPDKQAVNHELLDMLVHDIVGNIWHLFTKHICRLGTALTHPTPRS